MINDERIVSDELSIAERQETISGKKQKRTRTARVFPALSYEDSLSIGEAIWKYASGQKIRRLTLFSQIGKAPESGPSRTLITAANKYGIIIGSTTSEYIELTEKGSIATSEESTPSEKTQAHFELAIRGNDYLYSLYEQYKGVKVPSRQVLMDSLQEQGLDSENQQKCVDLFLVNAKYIGLIKVVSGSERVISIEQLLTDLSDVHTDSSQDAPSSRAISKPDMPQPDSAANRALMSGDISAEGSASATDWEKTCFYISPIGENDSEQRKHADLFMGSIVEPALDDLGLKVVRADSIDAAGIITSQIIEYIAKSKIVIADLSFHNPNVFYELSLRHSLGKPIIHLIRKCDPIPFDLHSFRTIVIDTSSIYTLVPQIESYKTSVMAQARQLLENPASTDNPISAVLEKLKKER